MDRPEIARLAHERLVRRRFGVVAMIAAAMALIALSAYVVSSS